jgi:hypothetical protein
MKTKKKVVLRTLDKNYIIIKCFNRNEFRKSFLDKYVNFIKKNKYISYKPKNYLDQIIYLKNINESKNKIIFLLEFNKKFVGTIGVQKIKKDVTLGILIFEKKIKNKGYSKYFLYGSIKFVKHLFGNNNYFAGINKNNFKSIYLFKSLGFKVKDKYQKNYLFYLNYNKINIPKSIDVFSIKLEHKIIKRQC